MQTNLVATSATILLALGCAGVAPVPTQQMADVQSANRSATELGAQNHPKAQLHLKLAKEQMQQATEAMEDDDNQTATRLLDRAKVDAELAIALTRADSATHQASKAANQRSISAEQGATP